jgi:uncharacterized protein YecE (DUF72 family)
MLAYYAARLQAVEANATFYRMPRADTLAQWRNEVPPGFVFALKAPQRVTHVKRLRDVEGPIATFYRAAAELGPTLGPVLYQLPPSLKKDVGRLEDFLAVLPAGGRTAFEFRHPSWIDDDIFEALQRHRAALCLSDSEEATNPLVTSASFGYLRLRRADYDMSALHRWAERILSQPWVQAFVFFKHEDEARGPALATALREVLGTGAAATPDAP